MMLKVTLLHLILAFLVFSTDAATTENPKMVRWFKQLLSAITGQSNTKQGIRSAKMYGRIQEAVPPEVPFPCDTTNQRSKVRPNSVHALRPGDIDVIASMGDSLSAGNGLAASNLLHIAVDNRGLSWLIGGKGTWRKYLTLPNILKEFNPKLVGYSQEDSSSFHRAAQFSVSEPGAMSRDMPHSARILVQRIKSDPRVDFENDWKLVNFFIGGNDFCVDVCYLREDQIEKSGESHRRDLLDTFDYIRDNMPRTLVNFILTVRTAIGTEMVGKPLTCAITHIFECPCLFGEVHKFRGEQMKRVEKSWIRVEEEVGNDERYRTREDFALVVQPFVPNSRIPKLASGKTDLSFVSADCFHFSQKGGAQAANMIWNNMLEPVGKKSLKWEPIYRKFLCPTPQHPYFSTWANSNITEPHFYH